MSSREKDKEMLKEHGSEEQETSGLQAQGGCKDGGDVSLKTHVSYVLI